MNWQSTLDTPNRVPWIPPKEYPGYPQQRTIKMQLQARYRSVANLLCVERYKTHAHYLNVYARSPLNGRILLMVLITLHSLYMLVVAH